MGIEVTWRSSSRQTNNDNNIFNSFLSCNNAMIVLDTRQICSLLSAGNKLESLHFGSCNVFREQGISKEYADWRMRISIANAQ